MCYQTPLPVKIYQWLLATGSNNEFLSYNILSSLHIQYNKFTFCLPSLIEKWKCLPPLITSCSVRPSVTLLCTSTNPRFYRVTANTYARSCCLSVCLSVKRMNCDKTKESFANILTPQERKIHLVFRHEECLVRNLPMYLKFWVKLTHPASKMVISN